MEQLSVNIEANDDSSEGSKKRSHSGRRRPPPPRCPPPPPPSNQLKTEEQPEASLEEVEPTLGKSDQVQDNPEQSSEKCDTSPDRNPQENLFQTEETSDHDAIISDQAPAEISQEKLEQSLGESNQPPKNSDKPQESFDQHEKAVSPCKETTIEIAQERSIIETQELHEESVNVDEASNKMLSTMKHNKPSNTFMSALNHNLKMAAQADSSYSSKAPSLTTRKECESKETESKTSSTCAERGRKPQPMAKPRLKPPALPRKPPKSILTTSTGNSPDASRSNSPHKPPSRSYSPLAIKSRSPSPKPPLPKKKPGLAGKLSMLPSPPHEISLALKKDERCEVTASDTDASRKSLKRISPMNISFTTEDLDLLHKPAEETNIETTIKRQESGDTSHQRAVKKDKRRSKSVGAPAFLDLLEQMQAKSKANGGMGVPTSLRRSLTKSESTIEENCEGDKPETPSIRDDKNLQENSKLTETTKEGERDISTNAQPNSLLNKQNSLIDKPGFTPPSYAQKIVVMDIDIDSSATPKRPARHKTTPPKPSIPSKPKALPPKPVVKKNQGLGSSPANESKTVGHIDQNPSKDVKPNQKPEDTYNTAKFCDMRNVFTRNNSDIGPANVTRNNSAIGLVTVRQRSELNKDAESGSADRSEEHKAKKKKKKSFSERFSMRKSSTSSSSVFYSDMDANVIDIGTASKFYVDDNFNKAVNSGNSQSAECGLKSKDEDVAQNNEQLTIAKSENEKERVKELVRFGSMEGGQSSSNQKEGRSTPEVHYYDSVEDQQSERGKDSGTGPKIHAKLVGGAGVGSLDIGPTDSEDLQDALDRTVSLSDEPEMKPSALKGTPQNIPQNTYKDDAKIYDNNFPAAVAARRSARSKKSSECKSEIGPSQDVKPRSENMKSVENAQVNAHHDAESDSESEFYDSFTDEEESDEEVDGQIQLSQVALQETVVEPKNKVKNIAMELCTTERAYVSKLKLVDQDFQNRIIVENRAHHMFPDNVIPQMFSNIKSIYQFHNDFLLVQLEKRMEQWDELPKIGDLMKKFAPFLKLYTDYVQNYDNARNVINLWLQKSSKFASLIEEIQKAPECGCLTLQHHMLGPVQRVPRYEMLLKQYISHLPNDSNDKEDAEEALRLVSTAASHSNEAMAKLDKFRKLWAINESVGGAIDLMNPTLELIKEGKVTKISQRNAYQSERYLFLFSEMLLVCRIMPVAIGAVQYKVKDELSLDGMHVLEGDNLITPNTFYVKSKEKSMEFHFASHDEKIEWHVTIVNVVSEYARKLMARQPEKDIIEKETALGLRAPTWIKDQETSMCMLCSNTFTKITRRRHHCRACGIVICGHCSSHKVKLPYDDNKLNRVCDKCYGILSGGKMLLTKTESNSGISRRKRILDVKAMDKSLICGYMQMSHDKKSWQKRWFAAHADFVLYSFKAHQDVVALTSMPLPGYQTEDEKDENNKDIIKLYHKCQKTYYFQADDNSALNRWKVVLSSLSKAEIPDSFA